MAKTDNLSVWSALETTDPTFTKSFDRGSFSGTAINPTYIVKRLTEQFGPCGKGWKFVLDDDEVIYGKVISGDVRESLHVVRGHLEYKVDGEWVETGPQYGQTKLLYETFSGKIIFDEEAPKKSITDCLSKCAALLGASADIYLGLWDANKYVNSPDEKGKKPAVEKSVPPPADMPAEFKGFYKWTPEQWQAFVAPTGSYEEILSLFNEAKRSKTLVNKVEVWPKVCKVFADKIRTLPADKENLARQELVAGLQEARKSMEPVE